MPKSPNLLVISGNRYAFDFRKYLLRAATKKGATGVHLFPFDSPIISYGDSERHIFNSESEYDEIYEVINRQLGDAPTIVLTGLSGRPTKLSFAAFKRLKKSFFLYDVYDDFEYAATGAELDRRKRNDLRWRSRCNGTLLLNETLRGKYPDALTLNNASPCVQGQPNPDRRRFVYVGSIDSRVDFEWLRRLADQDILLDIYGSVHPNSPEAKERLSALLDETPTFRFCGSYDNDDLQSIFAGYSTGILPYKTDTKMTNYVNPDKIYHYLNFGLEVLASPIERAKHLPDYLHLIDRDGDWSDAIAGLANRRAYRWPRNKWTWDLRWKELGNSRMIRRWRRSHEGMLGAAINMLDRFS